MALDEVVRRAQEGDARAFEMLVEKYGMKVRYTANRMVKDTAAAEDIAQNVWLKVWKHLSGFQGDSQFYTWVYIITVNEVRMYLRSRHTKSIGTSLDEMIAEDIAFVDAIEDRRILPEWRRIALMQCVEALPWNMKLVVRLHKLEGLEFTECAAVMGVAVGSAKAYYSRAKTRLKELLAEGIPMHTRSEGQRRRRAKARAAAGG